MLAFELLLLTCAHVYVNCSHNGHVAACIRCSGSSDIDCVLYDNVHTPCLRKSSQNCFCHNFVKRSLNLIIFGKKMAKAMKLGSVHSFSILPNLCQCTTV